MQPRQPHLLVSSSRKPLLHRVQFQKLSSEAVQRLCRLFLVRPMKLIQLLLLVTAPVFRQAQLVADLLPMPAQGLVELVDAGSQRAKPCQVRGQLLERPAVHLHSLFKGFHTAGKVLEQCSLFALLLIEPCYLLVYRFRRHWHFLQPGIILQIPIGDRCLGPHERQEPRHHVPCPSVQQLREYTQHHQQHRSAQQIEQLPPSRANRRLRALPRRKGCPPSAGRPPFPPATPRANAHPDGSLEENSASPSPHLPGNPTVSGNPTSEKAPRRAIALSQGCGRPAPRSLSMWSSRPCVANLHMAMLQAPSETTRDAAMPTESCREA